MTATPFTRLGCDRCGVETEHEAAPGHRPATWGTFTIGLRGGDLCPPCTKAIEEAMRAPDAAPPPPSPAPTLSLSIEDHRIAIEDATSTIRNAIAEAVAEYRATPTKMLDDDAFTGVLAGADAHAEALVGRIHARVKERRHD